MDRGAGDSGTGDLPWASVFDPAANARALSAIQAEGFRAASALVDRFIRSAGVGRIASDRPAGSTVPPDVEQRENLYGALDLEPLMRSWFSMLGQYLVDSGGSVPSTPPLVEGVNLDLAASSSGAGLNLEVAVPGMATTDVWLHNRSSEDLGDIRLRCSDLMAGGGSLIDSDEVRVDPAVTTMPARSSRCVVLEIKVSQDISPGVYRGSLLVEEHSDLWLPVALRVRAQLE